ncbi:hypothetical protein L1987_19700 [Smallanthus sonchifolius]|uniref:Uncharacterized protein n=1 Tax=Smallanthus sonchifolius TaxID=185202 RepID=A0ACB9IQK1_9ASTR|nr:hypothetical protein L1987_19700 [Smallanthus sonchifolius]
MDVDLSWRDYSIKVRVLRLWKQPMYNNPAKTYSIEMIVVDDEDTDVIGFVADVGEDAEDFFSGNSESINNTLTEIPFQETLNFKASLESTYDNVTPLSQTEQGDGKRHVGKEATFKRKSKNPDFKRKLVDAYDIKEIGSLSARLFLMARKLFWFQKLKNDVP